MKTKIALGVILFSTLISCNDFKESETKTISNNMEATTEIKKTLQSQLEERKMAFNQKADEQTKSAYSRGVDQVEKSGITSSAKQVGDIAPDFKLNNALGNPVSLKDYLGKGKVVLTWYRGGWCPYCNLMLHALQEELANFKAQGANLIALTPELPDESISTAEKHDLEFEVLSDVGNKVAREYGIVYKLTDEVATKYNQQFGLNKRNGDESNELPLAATYIINEEGEIVYAFLDADYTNRAEPSDLTNFLKNH